MSKQKIFTQKIEKRQALTYAQKYCGYNPDYEYCSIVRVRRSCAILPDYGVDGSVRDECDWAVIDMSEKIDTGVYGAVRYFKSEDAGVTT